MNLPSSNIVILTRNKKEIILYVSHLNDVPNLDFILDVQVDDSKYRKEELLKDCQEYGHLWCWMPHDAYACMRCGLYEKKDQS